MFDTVLFLVHNMRIIRIITIYDKYSAEETIVFYYYRLLFYLTYLLLLVQSEKYLSNLLQNYQKNCELFNFESVKY